MKHIKLLVIILAFTQPWIIISVFGWNPISFSETWGTKLEPLFIVVNASSSFFLFSLKRWKIPSLFLMLLTAFSTVQFEVVHNIFAVLFFISVFICLFEYTSLSLFPKLFLIGSLVGGVVSLFWMEFLTIYVLNSYHLYLLIKFWRKI